MRGLFTEIESSELSAEFYLFCSGTEWLFRWLDRQPALRALQALVAFDDQAAKNVAQRALELASSDASPGCRIRGEPALCCYAFVLATVPNPIATAAVDELSQIAAPRHGWLSRIIDRARSNSPTDTWSGDLPSPLTPAMLER